MRRASQRASVSHPSRPLNLPLPIGNSARSLACRGVCPDPTVSLMAQTDRVCIYNGSSRRRRRAYQRHTRFRASFRRCRAAGRPRKTRSGPGSRSRLRGELVGPSRQRTRCLSAVFERLMAHVDPTRMGKPVLTPETSAVTCSTQRDPGHRGIAQKPSTIRIVLPRCQGRNS